MRVVGASEAAPELLDEAALADAAAAFARRLPPGAIVALEGEMGSGKTTTVRAMLRALGATGAGTSPTYALVHRHPTPDGPVFHLDAWRLRTPDEAADLDLEALLAEARALLVEWPERLGGWLPAPTHRIQLAHVAQADRRAVAFRP